jgi:lysophospholipase L1-like esterase
MHSMSPSQIEAWQVLRRTINQMKSVGSIVLDASSALGNVVNGEPDGTYRPSLSDDGVHPNNLGHAVIAEKLISLLKGACE